MKYRPFAAMVLLNRPQFRLRSLLLLVAFLAVPLGVLANHERQYRIRVDAVRALQRQGVQVWARSSDSAPLDASTILDEHGVGALKRDDVVVGVTVHQTPVTDEIVTAMKCLPTITNLSLGEVTASQFEAMLKRPCVERLLVGSSDFDDIKARFLEKASSIRIIGLDHTKISGACLAYFSSMHDLELLDLTADDIDDESVRHLSAHPKLEWLVLSRTHVTDKGVPHLRALTHLTYLNLGHCAISDAGVAQLAALTSLKQLRLPYTRVSSNGLGHLRGLQALAVLDLEHCAISNAALGALCEMKSLRRINLKGTQVTGDAVARLESAIPGCIVSWSSPKGWRDAHGFAEARKKSKGKGDAARFQRTPENR